MPRPLSDSWQYFELLSPDNGRNRKAKCTFCGHEQAAGITRLHQHLLHRCSRITSDIREQLRQKQDDRGRDSPPKVTDTIRNQNRAHNQNQDSINYHFEPNALHSTLSNDTNNNSSNRIHNSTAMSSHSSFYESTTLPPTTSEDYTTTAPIVFTSTDPASTSSTNNLSQQQQQQSILDCQLARAFFSAKIPFDAVENPLIVDFFKRLQPNYILPKSGQLQQYLLKEQHWDLIDWDIDSRPATISQNLNLQTSPPHPPSVLQQQRRIMIGTESVNNNNIGHNNPSSSHLSNRLLSSLHASSDLEGSL